MTALKKRRHPEDARLSTEEAAAYLGYSPASLRSWRLRGGGPEYEQPHGPRGKALYWVSDLENWKKKNTKGK